MPKQKDTSAAADQLNRVATNGTDSESNLGRRRKTAQAKDRAAYAARRDELIASAAAVFQEEGYDGATLAGIAKRAGTDRASLYYYASSKEELFQQVCSGMLEANLAAAEDVATKDVDAPRKLQLIIEQHVTTNTRDNPQWAVLIHEMRRVAAAETQWSRDVVKKMRRYENIVRTTIEAGVASGSIRGDVSPTIAMHAIFGMLNWTHRWFRPNGPHQTSAIAHAFVGIALDGLANEHIDRGQGT